MAKLDPPFDATKIPEWSARVIRHNMEVLDEWLERGIAAIYNKQTEDEQMAEQTVHNNGVGFNGIDADIMSSFAKHIIAHNQNKRLGLWTYPKPLSRKQYNTARNIMGKYAGQLAKIANKEI